jgi:benzoyl-CoA reductase subunit D
MFFSAIPAISAVNSSSMTKVLTTAGIDVGSSSVKVAIVRSSGDDEATVLAQGWQRIRRRNVQEVARTTLLECCGRAGVSGEELDYVASTGDGDAVPFRTGHFYSMTTHARGALFLDPDVRAVLDVGALHARALRIDHRGKVLAHRMTSQCASGTGQFLENIARYLGVPLEDIGRMSQSASRAEPVSSICAVLAETDVINMVSRSIPTGEILRGIHESIAGRLVRLLRSTAASGVVMVTGGLSLDAGLLHCMDDQISRTAVRGETPQILRSSGEAPYAGALGGALLAARRYRQLAREGRLPAVDHSLGSSGKTSPVTASGMN